MEIQTPDPVEMGMIPVTSNIAPLPPLRWYAPSRTTTIAERYSVFVSGSITTPHLTEISTRDQDVWNYGFRSLC